MSDSAQEPAGRLDMRTLRIGFFLRAFSHPGLGRFRMKLQADEPVSVRESLVRGDRIAGQKSGTVRDFERIVVPLKNGECAVVAEFHFMPADLPMLVPADSRSERLR